MPRNGIKMTHFLRNNLGTILPKNTRAVKKKLLRSSWPNSLHFMPSVLLFGYSSSLSIIEEDLDMSGNGIIDLPDPVTGSEPVTKQYADTHYSGVGGSSKGDKGDKGYKGDQGIQGDKGDKGDQSIQGDKGDKGDKGIQGIQGDKCDKGDKGDKGDPGSGVLSASGFTMRGTIDMGNNKIENVADPVLANDPITKQYANRVYLTHSGFTMQDNIG